MTPSAFEMGYTKRDWSYLSSVAAFQYIFLWQAFVAGALDNIVLEQRSKAKIGGFISYLGTLRADEYGSRIRMTAYHAMQEKGMMAQAMRDLMKEAGMNSVSLERVE